MDSHPILQCTGLVAGYDRPVVGPVSLRLYRGEVFGLLGANGSGKSTLLKAITGVARRFAGQIERQPGLRLAHHRQAPVRPAEFPLTGHDLVRLTGAERRPAPRRLRPLLNQRLDRLSGGQFQLLQVWACLGSPAQLILLDEPTNNLDPTSLAILIDLIQTTLDGRTLLLVSHEASFVDAVCTRVQEVSGA